MEETTKLEDSYLELADQADGEFEQGYLFIRQDAPFMANEETVKLSPESQFALLEALYARRYQLYRATHLTIGPAPDWIESGKQGSVTRIVEALEDLPDFETFQKTLGEPTGEPF